VSAGICAGRPPSLNKVAVRGHKFRAEIRRLWGSVPVRDALSGPMSSHNRPLGGPRPCAGTHQAHQTPPRA
jgi:hypothetical protein